MIEQTIADTWPLIVCPMESWCESCEFCERVEDGRRSRWLYNPITITFRGIDQPHLHCPPVPDKRWWAGGEDTCTSIRWQANSIQLFQCLTRIPRSRPCQSLTCLRSRTMMMMIDNAFRSFRVHNLSHKSSPTGLLDGSLECLSHPSIHSSSLCHLQG